MKCTCINRCKGDLILETLRHCLLLMRRSAASARCVEHTLKATTPGGPGLGKILGGTDSLRPRSCTHLKRTPTV